MQAIERFTHDNSWITLVIISGIVLISLLKLINESLLIKYTTAFFIPGFFEKLSEEKKPLFNAFNILLFIFRCITISLCCFIIFFSEDLNKYTFSILLSTVIIYYSARQVLDYFLINTIGIYKFVNYFLLTKKGYLNTLSLCLFPFIIINQYSLKNKLFLITACGILFVIRGFLILKNNKSLIISKLFYFILYFCALEIAPLLILYKTIT